MDPLRTQPTSRASWAFLVFAGSPLTPWAAMAGPARAAVVTVSVSAPAGRETFSGGPPHDIEWFMDTDSGNPSLLVDFEYLLDGLPTTIALDIPYQQLTTNTRSG